MLAVTGEAFAANAAWASSWNRRKGIGQTKPNTHLIGPRSTRPSLRRPRSLAGKWTGCGVSEEPHSFPPVCSLTKFIQSLDQRSGRPTNLVAPMSPYTFHVSPLNPRPACFPRNLRRSRAEARAFLLRVCLISSPDTQPPTCHQRSSAPFCISPNAYSWFRGMQGNRVICLSTAHLQRSPVWRVRGDHGGKVYPRGPTTPGTRHRSSTNKLRGGITVIRRTAGCVGSEPCIVTSSTLPVFQS